PEHSLAVSGLENMLVSHGLMLRHKERELAQLAAEAASLRASIPPRERPYSHPCPTVLPGPSARVPSHAPSRARLPACRRPACPSAPTAGRQDLARLPSP